MFDQKRQHPVMIALEAIKSMFYLLPPLVIIALQNIGKIGAARGLLIFIAAGAGFLLLSIGYHALKWAFYTYRYEAGYLHIKAGILVKNERSIKRERVQTVNIRTGIIQRLLGLASLQVETAGGGSESELSLTAITLEEAQRIKENLERPETPFAESAPDEPEEDRGEGDKEGPKRKISIAELFLAGATSGRFLLLFSLITAAFSQALPFMPDHFWENLIKEVTSTAVATIAPVIALLLLLSWLISTIAFMIQYANFTLARRKNRLQVSWGLIEQKQLALEIHRVQALTIHEGVLRQPLGRCALVAEVAGGGSKEQDYVTVLFPLMRMGEVGGFFAGILPEYRLPASIDPLPARSCRRYILRAIALTVPIIVPLQWVPFGWAAFILLLPAVILGYSRYKNAGTALDDRQLTLRFRMLNRYTVIMLKRCVQALELSTNPFQRISGLKTIRAWVLSSPAGKKFQVADIDSGESRRLWQWYSRYS